MLWSHTNNDQKPYTKKVTYKFDWEVVRVPFPDPPAASPFHSPPFSPTPVQKYGFEFVFIFVFVFVFESPFNSPASLSTIEIELHGQFVTF